MTSTISNSRSCGLLVFFGSFELPLHFKWNNPRFTKSINVEGTVAAASDLTPWAPRAVESIPGLYWCVNVSAEYVYRCFSVWVKAHICKCISLSLSWLLTQSALWQLCLKPSLMKGLVYDRAEYWTVPEQTAESESSPAGPPLQLTECLRRGCSGKKSGRESAEKIWLLWWSIIFSITGKPSWCHSTSL